MSFKNSHTGLFYDFLNKSGLQKTLIIERKKNQKDVIHCWICCFQVQYFEFSIKIFNEKFKLLLFYSTGGKRYNRFFSKTVVGLNNSVC